MIKCPACHQENADEAVNCDKCGTALRTSVSPDAKATTGDESAIVTLRRYQNLMQAEQDRMLLEAAGVPAFLAGENTIAASSGSLLGELQLQIQAKDVAQARRILDEHEGFTPLPDDFVPPEQS